jgi:hypothetical protein
MDKLGVEKPTLWQAWKINSTKKDFILTRLMDLSLDPLNIFGRKLLM